nr:hypothetical protein Q903MT_gene4520 [Picea sitchensis]
MQGCLLYEILLARRSRLGPPKEYQRYRDKGTPHELPLFLALPFGHHCRIVAYCLSLRIARNHAYCKEGRTLLFALDHAYWTYDKDASPLPVLKL